VFQFINEIISEYRDCFKRGKTWKWFARLVIGCIIRNDFRGISSIVSVLRIKPELYSTLLKFFRSTAYQAEVLYEKLLRIILHYAPIKKVNGRMVLLADHIKISKEGLRMACIQKWHQESQNSGKPEYIEGHNFGVVSIVSEQGGRVKSIPVTAEIHESKAQGAEESVVVRMAHLMGKVAKKAGKAAIGVCDAYFFSKTMLETAAAYIDASGNRLLHIVTRAKKNAAGYKPVQKTRHRGRPKLYGQKVSLGSCFQKRRNDFTETAMKLYNKQQTLRFLCLDLVWKPVKKQVRFVLTELKGTHFILMCSDCSLAPEEIIQVYSLRFKIEVMFDDLKNDLGGFRYHFWSKSLMKRKRGHAAEMPEDEKKRKQATKAKKAIEVFVCLHIIALGILSLLSIRHSRVIWNHYSGWLRTVRTEEPSVMITKQVISQNYLENSPDLKKFPAFSAILQVKRPFKFFYRPA
jgi:hypothetical protein